MDTSEELATNISENSASAALAALKELHYAVSTDKTIIPVQIKSGTTVTSANTAINNSVQDISGNSTECPSLEISNKALINTINSNTSSDSPPLLTLSNVASSNSMSFPHESASTTVNTSTNVSNISSSLLSEIAPTTAINASIVSNILTGSQLLANSSVCSVVPITQTSIAVPQEQNFKWGSKQVNALINKVSEHFEEFYDHSVKKKEIWQIIAASMSQDGYKCTSSDCDKKWRNLKATYLKVLRKQIIGGTDYRFEHFSRLHNILGKEIDPLGMREQALSDGKEQPANSNHVRQHSLTQEDSATEGNISMKFTLCPVILSLLVFFLYKKSSMSDSLF
ncbi:unnamed protein product [Meganyctiphanes norvegica]|uniref:Myb/SANT-like DNA-binding domain-containing protein n=1 Tax=Meganyctiphanes norvegica TaxID=48144 RepID=A0AAV2RAZ4_MEGNR